MPDDMIATTSDVMVETDLMGVDSHGISMLMQYDQKFREGRLQLTAHPKIEKQTPVTALVDACANLGHPVSVYGMNLAIEKAKAAGLAAVSVRNSHHFGAAGYYARLAADQGLIGLVTSSARKIAVVPTRAAVPVLGTNPIAVSVPTKRNRPFVLDMATSSVAVNKVKVYSFQEKELPSGWVIDENGNPILDSVKAFDMLMQGALGGLTPIGSAPELGSHKGYGLGLIAHFLGGSLSGANFGPRDQPNEGPTDPENIGHFFMAIDPHAFRAEGDFEHDVDEIIDHLRATKPAAPDQPVLIPGDPEDTTRAERLANGIPIPDALAGQLQAVCQRANAEYVLTPMER